MCSEIIFLALKINSTVYNLSHQLMTAELHSINLFVRPKYISTTITTTYKKLAGLTGSTQGANAPLIRACLLYTSDAADE